MAHRALTFYARQLLSQPDALRRMLSTPLLVWQAPPAKKEEDFLLGTLTGSAGPRPTSGDPLVFEVRKGSSKQNAFGLGITVGRTENNDIAVDDNSVSRFHAYFQQDKTGGWTLVDAESRNGTWVDGEKLTGKSPRPVKPGAVLKFGNVNLRFFPPDEFIAFLDGEMKGP